MSTRGCPYLGLEYDSSTFHAFPSESNCCYKVRLPGPVDLEYQAAVCLTKSHVNCAIFTGEDEQLLESAASPIRRKPSGRGKFYGMLAAVAILILLAAIFLPGVNISALFESPDGPTPQPFFTRTPTVVLLVEPVMTATNPNLSFPLIIRQPTVTPLPTLTFTPTPTVTQTPVPTNTPRIVIQPTAVRQIAPTQAPPPTDPPVVEPTPPASRPN
jgi:hypothetical protein